MNPDNKRPPIVLILGAFICVVAPFTAFATFSELQDHIYLVLLDNETYRASYEATRTAFYISTAAIAPGFFMLMTGLIVSAIREGKAD